MKHLVSVIIPIYNMESSLKKCVESIQQQTYQNIEIILVNDGSTDDTASIVDELAVENPHIKAIHKENKGVSVARNKGLEIARGDYVSFVDPDDWTDTSMIERLLEVSLKENSDIIACGATAVVREEETRINNKFFPESTNEVDKERAISQLLISEYYNDNDKLVNIGVPWGKLYKTAMLRENKLIFNPKLRRNQDNIFNLYAFQYANKIAYIDEYLYFYDYAHFAGLHNKVTADAVELYSNLAIETYGFAEKYYHDNSIIMNLAQNKVIKYIAEMFNKKLLNPNYEVTFSQRVKEIREAMSAYPFANVLSLSSLDFVSNTVRVLFYLTKFRFYRITYSLLNIRRKTL